MEVCVCVRACVGVCVCVCESAGEYLQSREALCWATENDVSPPCSSPSRGAGEMLEHSRYPQCTSLKHGGGAKVWRGKSCEVVCPIRDR